MQLAIYNHQFFVKLNHHFFVTIKSHTVKIYYQ